MKAVSWGLLACGIFVVSSLCQAQAEKKEERKGTLVAIEGMQSRTPTAWVAEQTNKPFRTKQFRLTAVGDDKDNAEVVIFYFGEGGAGSIEDNIKRWKAQLVPPEGKTIDDVAKVDKKKINGLSATYFDARGTYLFKPRPAATETERRPNYRVIKVVLDTKKGPYFFSLIGPADTVTHYKKGFDEWLEGFK